jgi:LPXTG-site transpeptidase (sortase) family protein
MRIVQKSWRSRSIQSGLIVLTLFSLLFPSTLSAATSVNLGAADSFSVLPALSMTAAGAGTTVSGDLGLSPGLAVSKTGPWTVGGSEYFGTGGLSQTAQSDALTAFNALAGQSSDGAWSVSPWSPTPGVWTVPIDTSFTGTITLNGDYDDVWIFQVGRDLTFSGTIVMTGTAQPCNVFWQVGRDATIASGSIFKGTLIASRDIALASGAVVDGRIISLNSSLTTDGNTISGPTCATPPPTPTPTPAQTASSTQSSNSNSTSGDAGIDTQLNGFTPPTIIGSNRVDADSITINWGPYSGIDTFSIQYGLTNGEWLYSTNVTGFSTTLNDLSPNQPIWVRIAVRDSRTISQYGQAKFVGAPVLPRTGFSQHSTLFSTHIRIPPSVFAGFRSRPILQAETVSAPPRRLSIPAIGVSAPVEFVGVTPSGEMHVPSTPVSVGWLRQGSVPGEKGSAVIAGHVNDMHGNDAVFAKLQHIKKGDSIFIEDEAGKMTTFLVRESRLYDAGHADEVFGTNDAAHLNLITCEGEWNTDTQSYAKRLVVFADLEIIH